MTLKIRKSIPLHQLQKHAQLVNKMYNSSRAYMAPATAFTVTARYVANR